jgi:hypothetical protein
VIRFNHVLPDDEPKKKPRAVVAQKTDDTAVAIAIAVATAQAR